MPVFDQAEDRIVVHVVYDGPAFAGKTTNLEQLCTFFSEHRRSELFTTENAGERTVYLDWLQLEGGVVAGRKLRCQMITVPGQTVLARRRWHLLKRADVVVFVVEGTAHGVEEARTMFEMVSTYCRELDRELPLVVQANKLDLPGALGADEVARALGIDRDRVVRAQANVGNGVRETAVIAIRAAANVVQRRVLTEGVEVLAGRVAHGREIQAEIDRVERENPKSPISILLEEGARAAAEPEPGPSLAEPAAPAKPETGSADGDQALSRDTLPTGVVPEPGRLKALIDVAPGLALGAKLPRIVPPLPQPAVASGFIWPAATGRELLRSVPLDRATLCPGPAHAGVEATPQTFLFEAGTWSLKTSSERWFAGSDQARDALLALVRSKISLGPLLVSDTVLTLQTDPQGGYWLWTVTPELTTFEAALHQPSEQTSRLETILTAYADAALTTLRYAVRREVLLALHPGNFALIRGSTYYVADDIRHGSWPSDFGTRLLEPVDEFSGNADLIAAYVQHLVLGLRAEFRGADTSERLEQALRDAAVKSDVGQEARSRLLQALS